jgi:chromosomal replication initiation ATPase DnaA
MSESPFDQDASNRDGQVRDRSNYTIAEHIEHLRGHYSSIDALYQDPIQRLNEKRRISQEINIFKRLPQNKLYRDVMKSPKFS